MTADVSLAPASARSTASASPDESLRALTRRARLAVALGVAFWLVVLWAWPDAPFLMCFDDSFYYFEIAQNLAAGHGSTFDRINLTNGYHPLWMALCVPFYALGLEGMTAVRALLTFELSCWAGAWLLLVDVVVRSIGVWPKRTLSPDERAAAFRRFDFSFATLVFLSLVGPMAARAYANGLESGPYVLLYSLLTWSVFRLDGDLVANTTTAQRFGLGVLASLAFLARTDAGLALVWLALWQLPRATKLGATGVVRLVQIYLLPALTLAAFLALNQAWFGISLQVSGELKRVPPTPAKWAMIAAFLSVPVIVWLVVRSGVGTKFPRTKRLLATTGWFGVFVCCTFAYYLGLQTFARLWYFGPAIFYAALVLFTAFVDLTDGAVDEAKPGESPVAPVRTLSLLMIVTLLAGVGHQTWSVWSSKIMNLRLADRDAAVWIDQNLPESSVLGCWDAGVIGYHMRQRLVNLDGVVNSAEFLKAIKSGTTPDFVRKSGVRYIVNHMTTRDGKIDEGDLQIVRGVIGAEAVEKWELVKEWPFTFAGGTNRDPAGLKTMSVFLFKLPEATAVTPSSP